MTILNVVGLKVTFSYENFSDTKDVIIVFPLRLRTHFKL